LTVATDKIKVEAEQKFAELRKMLDEKESEVKAAIASIEKTKLSTIDSEVTKAKTQVDSILNAITQVEDGLKTSSDPEQFLRAVEEHEETLRHGAAAPDPEVKNNWFLMPKLNTQFVTTSLKNLKYRSGSALSKKYGSYPFPSFPLGMPLTNTGESTEEGEENDFYEEEEEPTYYADESNDFY
jgi:hypothetical protein